MSSDVRLAASVPAMMAVLNTAPFGPCNSPSRRVNALATDGGSLMTERAVAAR